MKFIFYGNYFYGLCAVALSIEAALQQRYPLNDPWYYLFVFLLTIFYYMYPYVRETTMTGRNPRSNWYTRYYSLMRANQLAIGLALAILGTAFLLKFGKHLITMPVSHWLWILVFPLAGLLYYGVNLLPRGFNLRNRGWLKPFVIGFTWAGLVNIYPVMYYDITHGLSFTPDLVSVFLFLKNFMFISVLCIMFDIKDYSTDYISSLRTFVVRLGLRKTIYSILLPLSAIGLGTFVYYAVKNHFHPMKVILNVIPFLLLLAVAYSLLKRRTILYYLVVVDGLMLIKAICGTLAMVYF